MAKTVNPLDRLLGQWESAERAIADLRRSASLNGHDSSRQQLRHFYLERHNAALQRLRGEIATIAHDHPILGRQPRSQPTVYELIVSYERLEREDAWYVWRIASGIHPQHIPDLRQEHAQKRAVFDAVWRDLSTRFAGDPRVRQLVASRNRFSG